MQNANDLYLPQITHVNSVKMELCFNEEQTRQILGDYLSSRLRSSLEQFMNSEDTPTGQVNGVIQQFFDDLSEEMQDTRVHIKFEMDH